MSKGGKSTKKASRSISGKPIQVTRKPDRSGLVTESTDNSTKVDKLKQMNSNPKKTKQPHKIGPSKPIK